MSIATHVPESRLQLEATGDPLAQLSARGPSGLDLVIEMAHDLRSPLTSIVALADMLRSGQSGHVNDLQRRQLGLVYTAALSLCATASDVIELARGGERLLEPNRAVFTPDDIFAAVQDVVRPMTEVKGLTLQLEVPVLGRRLGYPMALNRVLLNLATNAVKYTEEGFVRITARTISEKRVEFSVRDTGPGLDLDGLETVYQPFRPGTLNSRHHFSSAGLGLVMCRRLVSAMDSQLLIETQPNWGTLFYFEVDLPHAA